MKDHQLNEFSAQPLEEREIRTIRRIIRDQERMDWLWATLRIWAGWGVAIAVALYGAWEVLVRIARATK